jgi:hypothetical protein
MIYTHVARKGPAGVASPLDGLGEFSHEELAAAAAANRRLGDEPNIAVRGSRPARESVAV